MNRLVSFGDSFTWGSDLKDALDGPLEDKKNREKYLQYHFDKRKVGFFDELDESHKKTTWHACYSRYTWPALYAKEKNLKYVCYAQPGCSNQGIVRQVVKYLDTLTTNDLVVINWTWIDRWDFYNDTDIPIERWITVRPGENQTELSKLYFKHIHNQVFALSETLKSIVLVHNLLEMRKINFITTTIDKTTFDTYLNYPKYIYDLQKMIKNKFTWFENDDFLSWSKKNNFKISKKGHPLEEAHEKAFEYINEIT